MNHLGHHRKNQKLQISHMQDSHKREFELLRKENRIQELNDYNLQQTTKVDMAFDNRIINQQKLKQIVTAYNFPHNSVIL
jgi:hypothetical protein